MKTSFFYHPAVKSNPAAVSIARFTPRWWGPGRRYIVLAPSPDLLHRSRMGLPIEAYNREFNAYLCSLEPQRIWQDLQDKILICYERPGEHCHRRLVAAWLEKVLNVTIPEL
jgi:hypothetical protein